MTVRELRKKLKNVQDQDALVELTVYVDDLDICVETSDFIVTDYGDEVFLEDVRLHG